MQIRAIRGTLLATDEQAGPAPGGNVTQWQSGPPPGWGPAPGAMPPAPPSLPPRQETTLTRPMLHALLLGALGGLVVVVLTVAVLLLVWALLLALYMFAVTLFDQEVDPFSDGTWLDSARTVWPGARALAVAGAVGLVGAAVALPLLRMVRAVRTWAPVLQGLLAAMLANAVSAMLLTGLWR